MPHHKRRPLTAPLLALLLLAPIVAVSAHLLAPAGVPSSEVLAAAPSPPDVDRGARTSDTPALDPLQPIATSALAADARRGLGQPAPDEPAHLGPPNHHQSARAELAFLQQRRVGESMQVEARERSLALIAQSAGAASLSVDELRALQAREAKLEQRIDRHRRRLAITDRRIAALEASSVPANQEAAEELP